MRSPAVDATNPIFKPPFLDRRHLKGMGLDEIAKFLNETALFRGQWGYRPDKSINETDQDFRERIRHILNIWLNTVKTKNLLVPAVAYGYFPVNSQENDLIIWEDESRQNILERFGFPRQEGKDKLCIADFFRPADGAEVDYAAFMIVTMGEQVSLEAARLFEADSYSDYLHLHGIGVEMAEALAEYFHKRVREEWGFGDSDNQHEVGHEVGHKVGVGGLFRQRYRGGRYSWGYPACPNLEDNARVADLLEAAQLGISVGEETGWQYHPEQTTSAIICHHPQAKYFNTP